MKKLFLIGMLVCLLFLVACSTQSVKEVKADEFIGKEVTLSGVAKKTVKLGELSGYTLEDATGEIGVSTQQLPQEGEEVTVSGVLLKDTLFGYYVKLEK